MNPVTEKLKADGALDPATAERIAQHESTQPLSLYWHVRTLLYLGVTLLAGGLGVLIYKNIDTIGHAAIVTLIGILCAGCFYYCIRSLPPFSREKTESPGSAYDYILLLGCLLFLIFLGYLQWQYSVFGSRYGLATFIPAMVLLFVAYRFDHLGVLAMGLTLLASWVGISVTPVALLTNNDFSSGRLIVTAFVLALAYGLGGFLHRQQRFKAHFAFTWIHFAIHLAGISALAGLFTQSQIIWTLLLATSVYLMWRYAVAEKSFYVLLVAVVYGFIGAAFLVTMHIFNIVPEPLAAYLMMAFYIGGSIWLIRFLKSMRNQFVAHADL